MPGRGIAGNSRGFWGCASLLITIALVFGVANSCQIGIEFKPTTVGAKSATLNAIGLYGVTASAALSGTGT
jgi:hypothetical protein